MRLWHVDQLPVLPEKQLRGQWRELLAIVGSIEKKGSPNHLLVNKVMEYHRDHFQQYSEIVARELGSRFGVRVRETTLHRIREASLPEDQNAPSGNCYPGWHTDRYGRQCYYNLQEKYDCGGISEEEWRLIQGVAERNGWV